MSKRNWDQKNADADLYAQSFLANATRDDLINQIDANSQKMLTAKSQDELDWLEVEQLAAMKVMQARGWKYEKTDDASK